MTNKKASLTPDLTTYPDALKAYWKKQDEQSMKIKVIPNEPKDKETASQMEKMLNCEIVEKSLLNELTDCFIKDYLK